MQNIATLVAKLNAPLAWIARSIAANPKSALLAWMISLAVVAWVF